MFLITGITGKVGGAAARHLLSQGKQVRALVRNKTKAQPWADQGVELVEGTWEDVVALRQALQRVEGAYLMMPPTQTPSPDFSEAKTIIESYSKALAAVPPPKVVALSSMGSQQTHNLGLITSTHLLEEALKTETFPVAFIRAGGFYENYLYGFQTGKGGVLPTFYTPSTNKFPMIATDDIGAEVAKLLTSDWTGQRIIELGSMVSPAEVAADLGKVLGREVKAQDVPEEGWAPALEHMGFPKGQTGAFEEMVRGVNSGWIGFGVPGTEHIEGTTTAEQVFRAAQG